MDDGNKQGKEFYLNTHNYTLEQVEILSKVLSNKFNFKNTVQSHRNKYRIYIKTESIDLFRSLVYPNFHSSMLYKLY
jgi:hypothetical protein